MLMVDILDALVVDSASSALNRLGSSFWRRTRDYLSYRRSRKVIPERSQLTEAQAFLETLRPDQASNIEGYLASSGFAVVATRAAVMFYEGKGSTSKSHVTRDLIAEQVACGLYLSTHMEIETLRPFANLIADRLIAELNQMLKDAPLPAEIVGTIITTSADHAAASVRNCEIIRRLDHLDDIQRFVADLRTQVQSLHSKMRLPNINVAAPQPYERLNIEPRLKLRVSPDIGITSADILSIGTRAVVLGDPGAGKSTMAAKMAYDLALSDGSKTVTPFLVVLRDYTEDFQAQRSTLAEHLLALCKARYQLRPSIDALEYLLLNGYATVIFDGLDELAETTLRRKVVDSIEAFTHRYPDVQILVTSRIIGYDEAPLDSDLFPTAVIQSLSESQVKDYGHKWFELESEVIEEDWRTKAEAFLRESAEVNDLRVNPLMLSLMCQMYAEEG